ncbi:MAG: choice-of-anchor B family protein [Acidobacteriota bacterium]
MMPLAVPLTLVALAVMFSMVLTAGPLAAAGGPQEHGTACVDGTAEGYPCERVDLLAHMALNTIGGGEGSDIWGWTDPVTDKEYAIMTRSNGTAFVRISAHHASVYIGNLPTHTGNSDWRDAKTYGNYAYIVSEATDHGLQIFDMTQLESATPPAAFTETAHYDGFGRAHNFVINEASARGYAVGSVQTDAPFENCSGGLHILDLTDPVDPTFLGCYGDDGYTHDAQCVIYDGPDTDWQGQELCFAYNEDTLTIVDVTDAANPVQISRTGYAGRGYTHQGWLTEDHRRLLLDDEVDELNQGHNTRTYVWNVEDLDAPVMINIHEGDSRATDHNLYIRGQYAYQANYRAGLRILDLTAVDSGQLTEVAHFDIVPSSNNAGFSGAWSVYPFFPSGTVVVSGIEQGLFVLWPSLCTAPAAPTTVAAASVGEGEIEVSWNGSGAAGETYDVYRGLGGCGEVLSFEQVASGLTELSWTDTDVSGQVDYSYMVRAVEETGYCPSVASTCADAQTTGACVAPPIFGGASAVETEPGAVCAVEVEWDAGVPSCGSGVTYSVYRDITPDFTPGAGNRVANGLTTTSWQDLGASPDGLSYYVVRATDDGSTTEDGNLKRLEAQPTAGLEEGTWITGGEIGEPAMTYATVNEHVGWEPSTARFNSGKRSFFSTYSNGQCSAMITPPLQLAPGASTTMSFTTAYEIEDEWDGGVVEISTDGGDTWSLLTPNGGYPGNFRSSTDACGFLAGDPSFTGTALTFTPYSIDLSAFAGQEVLVRFLFSTDGGLTLEGWYVDDITLTSVRVPGSCELGSDVFGDGFELGNLSNWSRVQQPK